MEIAGAWGLQMPEAVRSMGRLAAERLDGFAQEAAGLAEDLLEARAQIAESAGTTWDSPAAGTFREGIQRHLGQADDAADHLRRAVDLFLRAAEEIRQWVDGIALAMEGVERRLVDSAVRHAGHLGVTVGSIFTHLHDMLEDPRARTALEELGHLREVYEQVSQPEMLVGLQRALSGSQGR
ncbi:hypothetical protein [Kocuria sp. HSID16901]|uniref:hypothetical protein n=1 Tax=Kocuria sp. HSID16901 TaxID=2419505 RepID=UPI0006606F53|nr:hypothetical protein [Kocuria sp. HSID16901]MCT1368292.1 hypothetical protein [Rothia sp. p3-SID1597]RUQ23200.1 hypothetical protein D8M21_00290 [Kocuria sp. HSID16901]